ncbi:MAG: hypothetical protein LBQ88_17475, partial [Treponema sp.]|nr:hypothetical protein [Treponema sp.]
DPSKAPQAPRSLWGFGEFLHVHAKIPINGAPRTANLWFDGSLQGINLQFIGTRGSSVRLF